MRIDIKKICISLINVRYERLLLLIYLPCMIINILSTNQIIMAILIHCLLINGILYSLYLVRQDIKQDIKKMHHIVIKINIKKEIFTKAFNNKPTTAIIKYNTLLNNSIN